jgi:glycosyltransferase involved in cell wall biosynthesis
MSASSAVGKHRSIWREAIKGRCVRLFSAGLGGGTPQLNYLASLGIPPERLFPGYDVVDNQYYATTADAAREQGEVLRQRLGLPEKYFLSSCRFIPEKNLPRLLQAYAHYRQRAGPGAWKFVLVGDGPLMPHVLELRDRLGLGNDLLLPGFKQYDELPAYYGLASAFVLASISETWGLVINEAMSAGLPVLVSDHCGCHCDLVVNGRNGYTFDPEDVAALSQRMGWIAQGDLAGMGQASREMVARWSPETFATNLRRAVAKAQTAPHPRDLTGLLLVQALLRR